MAPDKNTGIGSSVRPPGRWGGHLRCLPARWERGGEPSPGDSDEFSDSVSRHQPVRRHMRQSQRPPGRRPSRRQRRRRPSSLPGPPSRPRIIYGRGRTVIPARGRLCRLCRLCRSGPRTTNRVTGRCPHGGRGTMPLGCLPWFRLPFSPTYAQDCPDRIRPGACLGCFRVRLLRSGGYSGVPRLQGLLLRAGYRHAIAGGLPPRCGVREFDRY